MSGVWWRLAAMMALVYAVQGSWFPLLAVHLEDLGLSGRARGWVFATLALAALASPLGAGQLADRYFPAQRLLATCYALGAGLLVVIASGMVVGAWPLFLVFLLYWLLVVPGLGLSNAIAFRNLNRPGEQFGGVRLWGTIGWMAAGWFVSVVMAWSGTAGAGQGAEPAFWIGAIVAVVMAGFALTLPHTPPLAAKRSRALDLNEAVELVRRPTVSTYLIAAFGVSVSLPYMYQVIPPYLEASGLPRPWIASAMTLGQVLEVAALAVLPWMLRRFGYWSTLALGILAWIVRYGSLVINPPLWIAVAGILLHGVGFACFSIAGQMFLDTQAPSDRRAGAQGLNIVVTTGLGALVGNLLAGEVVGWLGNSTGTIFLIPCAMNAVVFSLWLWAGRTQALRGARTTSATSPPSVVPRPGATSTAQG